MLIDITLKITPKMVSDAQGNEKKPSWAILEPTSMLWTKIFH